MSRFTSANPAENSTLAEAQKLVRQRSLYRLACHGIFANPQGSTSEADYAPESDFGINGIKPEDAVRLVIRRTIPPEGGHGDYVNVGLQLNRLRTAADLQSGVIAMIEEDLTRSNAVVTPGEGLARLSSTPTVNKAIDAALTKEWQLVAPPPTVDPGPL